MTDNRNSLGRQLTGLVKQYLGQRLPENLICAYCQRPITEGPVAYDETNRRFIHTKLLPTEGDQIVCGDFVNDRDEEILENPFELLEREVMYLPGDKKPACTTMYMLLQAKHYGWVTIILIKDVEELYLRSK